MIAPLSAPASSTLPLRHLLLGLAVVAVWGTNFVVIKYALAHLPPLALAALRFALAEACEVLAARVLVEHDRLLLAAGPRVRGGRALLGRSRGAWLGGFGQRLESHAWWKGNLAFFSHGGQAPGAGADDVAGPRRPSAGARSEWADHRVCCTCV